MGSKPPSDPKPANVLYHIETSGQEDAAEAASYSIYRGIS